MSEDTLKDSLRYCSPNVERQLIRGVHNSNIEKLPLDLDYEAMDTREPYKELIIFAKQLSDKGEGIPRFDLLLGMFKYIRCNSLEDVYAYEYKLLEELYSIVESKQIKPVSYKEDKGTVEISEELDIDKLSKELGDLPQHFDNILEVMNDVDIEINSDIELVMDIHLL